MRITYFRLGEYIQFVRISDRDGAQPTQIAKATAVIEDEVRRERLPYEIRKLLKYAQETHAERMKQPA